MKNNLYRCYQASRNWFFHLTKGLEVQGFKASPTNLFLFLCHNAVICLYTDDCIIFVQNSAIIKNLIQDLFNDFLLSDEDSIEDFLVVRITCFKGRANNCGIDLRQTSFIDTIIKDLCLDSPQTKYENHSIPSTEILFSESDLPKFREKWSYRSVIGKLNFLTQNTKLDIAFAVHQCDKFCNNSCEIHSIDVKSIGKYLKTTRNKGLNLQPNGTHQLNAYVDSVFCGA